MSEANVSEYDSLSVGDIPYINDLFIHAVMPTPPRIVSSNYNSIIEKVACRRDEKSSGRVISPWS